MPDHFVNMLTDIAKAAEEAGPMRTSSFIRQRGDRRRNRHRTAVRVLSAVAVGATVATGSFFGLRLTADSRPAVPDGAASSTATADRTASPAATPSSSSTVKPTASAEASLPPATATQLSVTITGPSRRMVMPLGGKEVDFAVTITNPTRHTFSKIKPLVYVGKCTCSENPVRLGPSGTMKVKQPDGSWKPVEYSHPGGGMDYVGADQMPAFTLAPGATVSFTYRIGFSATQHVRYHDGDLEIGVLMLAMPGYTAVGPTLDAGGGITILGRDVSPLAFVPVHVTVN